MVPLPTPRVIHNGVSGPHWAPCHVRVSHLLLSFLSHRVMLVSVLTLLLIALSFNSVIQFLLSRESRDLTHVTWRPCCLCRCLSYSVRAVSWRSVTLCVRWLPWYSPRCATSATEHLDTSVSYLLRDALVALPCPALRRRGDHRALKLVVSTERHVCCASGD